MRRLLWAAAWVGVFFWSVFALLAYGLVDFVGGTFMRHADVFSTDPGTVESLFNLFGWIRGFSTSAITVVWGLVSLAILAVPWLFDRFARSAVVVQGGDTYGRAPARDGVIDLGPGDYSVRDPASRAAGPAPRIGPRR